MAPLLTYEVNFLIVGDFSEMSPRPRKESKEKRQTTGGKPRGGPRCALDRALRRKGGHGAMSLGLGLQGTL